MDCPAARIQFSGYLDGAVSGRVMQSLADHFAACPDCSCEFAALRGSQRLLSALGPAKAPTDLALRLRVTLSQQQTLAPAWGWERIRSRWENAVAPLLIQAGAGLASTVVLLSIIAYGVGVFAVPPAVLAHDEPLQFHTPPHLLYVAASADSDTAKLNEVVVEASINTRGQVYDYRIVAGPDTLETRQAVAGRLLLSVFEPARMFGMPVNGQAILSFAGLEVTP